MISDVLSGAAPWHVETGDALAVLRTMPDECVQCCVTSPPFFNLRDYGVEGQMGLEATPAEYVARMVEVFREARRVLRSDGTLWLDIGDSFSSGGRSVGANRADALQRFMKGQPLYFRNATAVGITSERGDVALHDDGFPYGVFLRLLGVKRVTIKQRDNHFSQVLHTLTDPCYCRITVPIAFVSRDVADLEIVLDSGHDVRIIVANHDADAQSILPIPRVARGCTTPDGDCALPVEKAREPMPERVWDVQAAGHSVSFDAPLERLPDVYLVDEAIPFRDGLDSPPGRISDFSVAEASEQHLTLFSEKLRVSVHAPLVAHLYVSNADGSFLRYAELYHKAIHYSNAVVPKQLLGIPWMLARALQEDGWILRGECIWCKSSPMPESVRDRPTRAHEQVFLLSKSPRYVYDQEAERPPNSEAGISRAQYAYNPSTPPEAHGLKQRAGNMKPGSFRPINPAGRSLWTYWNDIAPSPDSVGHFALMPLALASRCVRLGTSARGACPRCGAAWRRVVERTRRLANGRAPEAGSWHDPASGHAVRGGTGAYVAANTTGWRPGCACPDAPPIGCVVLDPFCGAGTSGVAARNSGQRFLGVELSPKYADLARSRIAAAAPLLDYHDKQPTPVQGELFS